MFGVSKNILCNSKLVESLSFNVCRNSSTSSSRKNIVFIDGVRTPFCKSNTSFDGVMGYELASSALKGLVKRTGLKPEMVDYVCMGTVIQECATTNIAREAMLTASFPDSIPAHTVTMACISSNQAITSGIGMIHSGQAEVVVAGGVDTLSDPPIRLSKPLRAAAVKSSKAKGPADFLKILFGLKMKDIGLEIPSVNEFSSNETMGKSADRLAYSFNVSRKEQDLFAISTHTNAERAQKEKLLSDIVPVSTKKGIISTDNTIRVSTIEQLTKLKPVFIKGHGTITAGNSSPLTDGASACLIMTEEKALELGFKPKAYLRDFIYTAQDPKDQLLIGPAYAMPKLMLRNNLTWKDISVAEVHEAFSGQILSVMKALESEKFCKNMAKLPGVFGSCPKEILNLWGGSVSLGHPFGATGARLVTMAVNRMIYNHKNNIGIDNRYGIISGCAAGGLAHAMLVERYTK